MALFVFLLEAFAFIALSLGALIVWRLTYSNSSVHRRARMLLLLALGALSLALVLNGANLFQRKTGINLHIAADMPTKALLWVKDHQTEPPDRGQTSRNLVILADGLAFLREHRDELSPDAKTKVAEFSELPGKPDHLLSIGEEGRYYRAAKDVYEMIGALAQKAK